MSDPKTAPQRRLRRRRGHGRSRSWARCCAPSIVSYSWIFIAIVLGTIVGVPLSWVPLTAVPQRTALSHAFGGLAAGLVGIGKYYLWLRRRRASPRSARVAIVVEVSSAS